ncbi:MAG TPA: response regulator [Verrucomicrobiae bacterium]|jgi:CheY-like chemotaxis protein
MNARKILVVEDDPQVSAALTTRLRSAGYDVLAAPGPHIGENFARLQKPDLIITDIMLPTMDGLTFVRKLKQDGLSDVPFMVITASYQDGLWESAMNLGATAYFEKPYDGANLLLAVNETLNPKSAASTERTEP